MVFEVAVIEHVMMYLSTGKTVANHDSCCVSETAAEARLQTILWARTPREVHSLCRRRHCRRRRRWLTNKTRRRSTPFVVIIQKSLRFFIPTMRRTKELPYIICFFKRFRIIFSLSYSFSLFLSASFFHDFIYILYIYCLWLLLAWTYWPILVS